MASSKKAPVAAKATAGPSATAQRKLAKAIAAEKAAAEKAAAAAAAAQHEPQCSVRTLRLLTNYVDNTVKTSSSLKDLLEGFVSDKITLDDLREPKEGDSRAFWESLRTAVRNGFTPEVRALIAEDADTTGWSEEKIGDRRFWKMQIGSKIKDIRNSYEKRLDKIAKAEAKKAAQEQGEAAMAALKANDEVKALAELRAGIAKVCANYVARIEKSTATWDGAAKCKTALRQAVKAAS
jgi:hypothetical protein